jgi:Family of unknown function (DUF5681)
MKDYKVGYGKPPKDSQFQKGQSGNPKGRSKNVRNLKTDLIKLLGQRISVREGDRKFKVSAQEGVLMALMSKSLKGDTKAITTLVNLLVRIFGLEEEFPGAADRLSPQEQQIIDEMEANFRKPAAGDELEGDHEGPGGAA